MLGRLLIAAASCGLALAAGLVLSLVHGQSRAGVLAAPDLVRGGQAVAAAPVLLRRSGPTLPATPVREDATVADLPLSVPRITALRPAPRPDAAVARFVEDDRAAPVTFYAPARPDPVVRRAPRKAAQVPERRFDSAATGPRILMGVYR